MGRGAWQAALVTVFLVCAVQRVQAPKATVNSAKDLRVIVKPLSKKLIPRRTPRNSPKNAVAYT